MDKCILGFSSAREGIEFGKKKKYAVLHEAKNSGFRAYISQIKRQKLAIAI